jgi:hypothetical protein
MIRDYDGLIKAGVKAQIEKLNLNKHKKSFDKVTLSYAYRRLKDEMEELRIALASRPISNKRYEDIRKEFADIANFAHMGIYHCDQELTFKQKR